MSKSRFTTTDVKALVRDIRSLTLGKRLANVYDLSDKCYMFKFVAQSSSDKTFLLMESGIRFHTTKFARDMPELPSSFAMKLRKHIRTKRLEDIRQLGEDRVVDFRFGSGDAINHVILELYANGNIVLTDANYQVLALLRSHQFAEDVSLRVNEIYPLLFSTNIVEVSAAAATSEGAIVPSSGSVTTMTPEAFCLWASGKNAAFEQSAATAVAAAAAGASDSAETSAANKKAAKKASKAMTLKQLLLSQDSGVSHYGAEVLEHCILQAGISGGSSYKVDQLVKLAPSVIAALLSELTKGVELISTLLRPGCQSGYIILKESPTQKNSDKNSKTEQSTAENSVEFLEYVPLLLAQHQGKPSLAFPSFNEAVDEYYCKIEDQRLQRGAASAEEAARKKVEKVRKEQEQKIQGLEQAQERMAQSAALLELYAEDVDKVCLVINSALQSGMAWEDIEAMVNADKAKGNSIAKLVHKLRLERNHVILRLSNLYEEDSEEGDDEEEAGEGDNSEEETAAAAVPASKKIAMNMFDSDSDEEEDQEGSTVEKHSKVEQKPAQKQQPAPPTAPKSAAAKPSKPTKQAKATSSTSSTAFVDVEIDLALSAFANARNMYSNKKTAKQKELKTVSQAARVIQSVEEQTSKMLEKQQIKRHLSSVRKVHWFEKFNWFITSEGYLVLSGKDAHQNEALFKKYLRPGDVYVHADLSGASSCIVRAKSAPVSDKSIATATSAGVASATATANASASAFKPISPLALQEAGTMAVCRSSAWSAKIITSAWWVWAGQVSKTAPSGEYLTTGSFMIYGKKNYLPPMPLEMGFGVMFRLDDGSVGRHLSDRRERNYDLDMETMSVMTEAFDRYGMECSTVVSTGASGTGGSGAGKDEEDNDDEEQDEEGEGVDQVMLQGSAGEQGVTASAAAAADVDAVESANDDENDDGGESDERPETEEYQTLKSDALNPTKAPAAKTAKKASDNAEVETNVIESAPSKPKHWDAKRQQKQNQQAKKDAKSGASGKPPLTPSHSPALWKETDSEHQSVQGSTASQASAQRKKNINKKKARRYAEQDDEDRELAMLSLGHTSTRDGEKLNDKLQKIEREKKSKDLQARQEKAGIRFVKDDWSTLMGLLGAPVRTILEEIIAEGFLKEGELDAHEMRSLAAFPTAQGCEILDLFRDGKNLQKMGNKSGFLAGIMRRYGYEQYKQTNSVITSAGESEVVIAAAAANANAATNAGGSGIATETTDASEGGAADVNAAGVSRRERKRQEQREIQEILEEEGVLDEEEGKQADELEKLTGCPLSEDTLLYAVPVCGPYSSLQNFKFRVKLTPGTLKKGKAAKQALEMFTRSKECLPAEKNLMKGFTDPEVVAVIIGDVKLSMPGLQMMKQQVHKNAKLQRGQKKG